LQNHNKCDTVGFYAFVSNAINVEKVMNVGLVGILSKQQNINRSDTSCFYTSNVSH